jgi:hypothetical protein
MCRVAAPLPGGCGVLRLERSHRARGVCAQFCTLWRRTDQPARGAEHREHLGGQNGRLWKAGQRNGQRKERYEHGTRGFRLWSVDIEGVIALEKEDDWTPLAR